MNQRYENSICPVCNKPFNADDDVVVCPVCGTPHHRECWKKYDCCINSNKHKDGYNWSDDHQLQEEKPIVLEIPKPVEFPDECPHCGEKIHASMPFCPKCGGPLFSDDKVLCVRCGTLNESNSSFCARCGAPLIQSQKFSDARTGTVLGPDDKIDDVTVSEMSTYIRFNSEKYIPKFFRMNRERKKVSWNWASFFFAPYWFFYRKIYSAGAVMMSLLVALNLIIAPQLQPFMDLYYKYIDVASAAASTTAEINAVMAQLEPVMTDLMPVVYIFLAVQLVIHLFCGLFGDKLYQNQIKRNVTKWRAENHDGATYQVILLRKGGVSSLMAGVSVILLPMAVNICTAIIQLF